MTYEHKLVNKQIRSTPKFTARIQREVLHSPFPVHEVEHIQQISKETKITAVKHFISAQQQCAQGFFLLLFEEKQKPGLTLTHYCIMEATNMSGLQLLHLIHAIIEMSKCSRLVTLFRIHEPYENVFGTAVLKCVI